MLGWRCYHTLVCPRRARQASGPDLPSHVQDFTYLEISFRLPATVLVGRCQVLPEQSVVDVAAAVEVEERRDAGGLGRVALGLGLAKGLESAVQAVDVCLVVLGVVQLHDLAGDVRLECTVVVYRERASVSILLSKTSRKAWRECRRNRRTRLAYMTDRAEWPCRGQTACWPCP